MKDKWSLITGLVLLTTGIILKAALNIVLFLPLALIIAGIALKVYYIFSKIKGKKYTPGIELLVLLVGLTLFFAGIHLPVNKTMAGSVINPEILKIAGIILKAVFIFLFIKKTRNRE